jgi:hypothetical protein
VAGFLEASRLERFAMAAHLLDVEIDGARVGP